ncbi:MAG: hypothetical protein PVF73_14230 [Bacteroidales bacterium]|jgi:hypothetical protein
MYYRSCFDLDIIVARDAQFMREGPDYPLKKSVYGFNIQPGIIMEDVLEYYSCLVPDMVFFKSAYLR